MYCSEKGKGGGRWRRRTVQHSEDEGNYYCTLRTLQLTWSSAGKKSRKVIFIRENYLQLVGKNKKNVRGKTITASTHPDRLGIPTTEQGHHVYTIPDGGVQHI